MTEEPDRGLEPERDDAEGGSGESTEAPTGTAATTDLPFPGYVATAFYRFHQTTFPRRWCLTMITWPYPFHICFYILENWLIHT